MKIWLDDCRPAPDGYTWCKSVNEAKSIITNYKQEIECALDEYDFPSTELWNKQIEEVVVSCNIEGHDMFVIWLENNTLFQLGKGE